MELLQLRRTLGWHDQQMLEARESDRRRSLLPEHSQTSMPRARSEMLRNVTARFVAAEDAKLSPRHQAQRCRTQ